MESIAATARGLDDWIRTVAGEVRIDRGAPPVAAVAAADGAATIHVLLLGIDGPLDPNDARRGHRRFALQHLLLASEAEPMRAADLVATLLIAGLDHPDFDARAADCADPLWATLGIAPRPGVRLAVPWLVAHGTTPAAPVREPIALAFARLDSLEGLVVGPDDLRIAGARVRLSGTGRVATTDGLGRFRFDGVAPAGSTLRIEVVARGKSTRVAAKLPDGARPLRIEIDPTRT